MNDDAPNRETFIALKARKQGYQIASQILHPQIKARRKLRIPDAEYLDRMWVLRAVANSRDSFEQERTRVRLKWIMIGAAMILLICCLTGAYLALTGTVR